MKTLSVHIRPESYARAAQEEALSAQRRGLPIPDQSILALMSMLVDIKAIIDPDFQTLFNEVAMRRHTGTRSRNKGGRPRGVLQYDPWDVVRSYYDMIDAGEAPARAKLELAEVFHKDVGHIASILREHVEWPWCADENTHAIAVQGAAELAAEYRLQPGESMQISRSEGSWTHITWLLPEGTQWRSEDMGWQPKVGASEIRDERAWSTARKAREQERRGRLPTIAQDE